MMFVFFNVTFFPMHIAGLLGMPRRVYTFPAGLGWEPYNLVSSIGAIGFGISAFLIVVNLLLSLRWGREAGANPWGADTLEWAESSPPPAAQIKLIPFVRSLHPLWDQTSLAPGSERDRSLIEPLRSGPTSWRGALVVTPLEARPLAIVQLPAWSYWPFVMSLAFLAMFAGALVESAWLAGAGLLVSAVALVGWHWPDPRQDLAVEELGGEPRGDRLPLGIIGPLSNGWWGMLVFLLVMAVALACLVGSYFYLGEAAPRWPPVPPALGHASLATLVALTTGAGSHLLGRSARSGGVTVRRLCILATLASGAAFIWITFVGWSGLGLRARESAYASIFVSLLAFESVTAIVLIVLLTACAAWAWTRPADPRARGVALLAELQGYFLLGSWLMVYAVLYLAPRLG